MTKRVWKAQEGGKKRGRGRPLKFDGPEALREAIYAYFHWVEDNPRMVAKVVGSGDVVSYPVVRYPTMDACAAFIGVSRQTWHEWGKEGHRLKEVVDWAEQMIYVEKIEGAAAGQFNPAIVAREMGLAEKVHGTGVVTVNVIDSYLDDAGV